MRMQKPCSILGISERDSAEEEEEEAVGGACRWLTGGGIDLTIMRYEVTGDKTATYIGPSP